MTGHLLGAAGGIESIASLLSIQHGFIPPTIHYEQSDPDCDLNYVPNKSIKQTVNYSMSNSFGFGGTNGSLVFRKIN